MEELSGIKAHTIRIWERRYNIVKPHRTPTNIRYYDNKDLQRILNIAILKHIGFRISKIANLTDEELFKSVLEACVESGDPKIVIDALVVEMLSLDEAKFLSLLTGAISKNGIESAFENVILPFIDRIGILCDSGTINPAQQRFIFNLIRQKLIVAIDKINENRKAHAGRRLIFFMPESSWQEMSLLFYSLIARKEGFEVLYLGASPELNSLKEVYKLREDDVLFISIDSNYKNYDINKLVSFLNENFHDALKVVTGLKSSTEVEKITQKLNNALMVCSSGAFKDVLQELSK